MLESDLERVMEFLPMVGAGTVSGLATGLDRTGVERVVRRFCKTAMWVILAANQWLRPGWARGRIRWW